MPAWEKKHETMDGIVDSSMVDLMTVAELKQEIAALG